MKNITAELLREPLPPRVLDSLPMTTEEFTQRYLAPMLDVQPPPEPEPLPFNPGDIVTIGMSKTRWRVGEVQEGGVTMLQITPAGRR